MHAQQKDGERARTGTKSESNLSSLLRTTLGFKVNIVVEVGSSFLESFDFFFFFVLVGVGVRLVSETAGVCAASEARVATVASHEA